MSVKSLSKIKKPFLSQVQGCINRKINGSKVVFIRALLEMQYKPDFPDHPIHSAMNVILHTPNKSVLDMASKKPLLRCGCCTRFSRRTTGDVFVAEKLFTVMPHREASRTETKSAGAHDAWGAYFNKQLVRGRERHPALTLSPYCRIIIRYYITEFLCVCVRCKRSKVKVSTYP